MTQKTSQISAFTLLFVVIVVAFTFWMSSRRMTQKQITAFQTRGALTQQVSVVFPKPYASLFSDAGRTVRVDIELRMDGLEILLDGGPVCFQNGQRLVTQSADAGAGTYDRAVFVKCLGEAIQSRRETPIAIIKTAGPLVPKDWLVHLLTDVRSLGISRFQLVNNTAATPSASF